MKTTVYINFNFNNHTTNYRKAAQNIRKYITKHYEGRTLFWRKDCLIFTIEEWPIIDIDLKNIAYELRGYNLEFLVIRTFEESKLVRVNHHGGVYIDLPNE